MSKIKKWEEYNKAEISNLSEAEISNLKTDEKYALVHYKKGLVGEDLSREKVNNLMDKHGGVFTIIPMKKFDKSKVENIKNNINLYL